MLGKITLTIEDKPNGKVKVTANPTVETLLNKIQSGNELTSAEGYAMLAVNAIRNESKKLGSNLIVKVPRIVK